jgi:fatty acid desaturase
MGLTESGAARFVKETDPIAEDLPTQRNRRSHMVGALIAVLIIVAIVLVLAKVAVAGGILGLIALILLILLLLGRL